MIENPRCFISCQTLILSLSVSWRTRIWTLWGISGRSRFSTGVLCNQRANLADGPNWFEGVPKWWNLLCLHLWFGYAEAFHGWKIHPVPSWRAAHLVQLGEVFKVSANFYSLLLDNTIFPNNAVLGSGCHSPMPARERWWRPRGPERPTLSAWQVVKSRDTVLNWPNKLETWKIFQDWTFTLLTGVIAALRCTHSTKTSSSTPQEGLWSRSKAWYVKV